MSLIWAVLSLLVTLGLQAGLAQLWPAGHAYIDWLYLPVVWYGLGGTQRSAMLVGCAAGLLQDGWFQVGVFGLNGFKKTLLGWALGGAGTRFDLNSPPARLVTAIIVCLADSALDPLLRRLLDQSIGIPRIGDVILRALATGLILTISFAIVDRFRERGLLSRWF